MRRIRNVRAKVARLPLPLPLPVSISSSALYYLSVASLALAVLLLAGCDDAGVPTTPLSARPGGQSSLIAGRSHFAFLPPIAPRRAFNGEFDATLHPVVEVCVWTGAACASPLVARLTDVKVRGVGDVADADDDGSQPRYSVQWQTRGLNLDPARRYRLRVLVAGVELGFADIAVVANERDAKRVDASQYAPLIAGKNLRINFRIERGAITVVGAAGGHVATLDGRAAIDVPPGAVSGDVGFTIAPTSVASPAGGFLVGGAIYEFGPHGTTFAVPVHVVIRYDEAQIPVGKPENELTLMHFVNGAWQGVPGSIVDVVHNTVSGDVSSFSPFAAGGGTLITMSAWGTAVVDGTIDFGTEWAMADCRIFAVTVGPSSTTNAKFCVMNDATNLFASLSYSWPAPTSGDYQFYLSLDNTDDGRTVGDDAFAVQPIFSPAPGAFLTDLFLTDGGLACASTDHLCHWPDADSSGTNDGFGVFSAAGGVHSYEITKPLASLDVAHDMNVSGNATLGFMMSVVIGSWSNSSQFPFPSDHGHIRLAAIDQQQPFMDLSVGGLAIGGGSEQILAQVVTPGVSGSLVAVSFPVACDNGVLQVEIQSVTNGQPNGTVLGGSQLGANVLPSFAPNPPTFRDIPFAFPVGIVAGTPFAIVLKNPTGSCGVFQGPGGDNYPGGDGWFDARPNAVGVWEPLGPPLGTRQDLPFKTVVK